MSNSTSHLTQCFAIGVPPLSNGTVFAPRSLFCFAYSLVTFESDDVTGRAPRCERELAQFGSPHRLTAQYRQALIQQEWLKPQTGTEMMAMQLMRTVIHGDARQSLRATKFILDRVEGKVR
jgi:hypothetical protein